MWFSIKKINSSLYRQRTPFEWHKMCMCIWKYDLFKYILKNQNLNEFIVLKRGRWWACPGESSCIILLLYLNRLMCILKLFIDSILTRTDYDRHRSLIYNIYIIIVYIIIYTFATVRHTRHTHQMNRCAGWALTVLLLLYSIVR